MTADDKTKEIRHTQLNCHILRVGFVWVRPSMSSRVNVATKTGPYVYAVTWKTSRHLLPSLKKRILRKKCRSAFLSKTILGTGWIGVYR